MWFFSLTNRNATLKKDKSQDKKERKRHSGFVQMFSCKQCPVSFSRSWYLQLHMTLLHYSHQKNTSIECPGCNLRWEKEEHLRQHVENSHNSVRRLKLQCVSFLVCPFTTSKSIHSYHCFKGLVNHEWRDKHLFAGSNGCFDR